MSSLHKNIQRNHSKKCSRQISNMLTLICRYVNIMSTVMKLVCTTQLYYFRAVTIHALST